jgi:hypothetical protein
VRKKPDNVVQVRLLIDAILSGVYVNYSESYVQGSGGDCQFIAGDSARYQDPYISSTKI